MQKKKTQTFISIALAIGAMLIILWILIFQLHFFENQYDVNENSFTSDFVISEETVTATGTTSIGVVSEMFDPDYISATLYIEEVYVTTGDEIQEHTKLFKISDDSLEEARTELENAAEIADLAYRAGVIEYEQSKITAKYDYDITVLESEQAKEVYQETLDQIESNLEQAQNAVDEAEAQIEEYTDAIANDTYTDEYQVQEKLATYNNNLALLNTKSDEWGIPYSAFTSQMGGGGGYDQWELTTLQLLYAELEENLKDYEQAVSDYENAVENAQIQLDKLNVSIKSLKNTLYEAQENYDEKKIAAETSYQISLAKEDLATSDYETALSKAQEDYTALVDAKEEADDNLEEFESLIGDGYFYSSSSGTILMSRVSAESYLQGGSVVIAYSDPSIVTVSVDVDQADISKLSVGDSATLIIDSYGRYTGTISEINPISDSTNRTSITYAVTIEVYETDSMLTSNLTAEVYFNMGEQAQ